MGVVYWSAGVILLGCIIAWLSIVLSQIDILKYIMIFAIGLFLIYLVLLSVYYCDWEIYVVYWSAGIILGIGTITCLIIGLNQNEIMKYLLIFAIGLFLIYLVFLIVHYSASKMKIVYSSAGLILSICSMTCILMGEKEFEVLKYILIFVTGLILIFLFYVLSACCDWEMGVVYWSAGVIFGICILVSLIMGSFEVSYMKYILIGVIGIILIVICFAICSNEIEVAITGTIIIIATCIVTGLTFVFVNNGIFKYVLIFAVGTYIVFIIFLIMALSDSKEMEIVYTSAGILLGICFITCLIYGSFEVSVVRYITIGLIGILLIVLCFVKYRDSMDVAFTGTIYIIAACIMTGLITNDSNYLKHVLIFTIGTYVACIVYLMCAIFEWEMGFVFGVSIIIMGVCSLVSLILGSFELTIFKYISIGMFGLGLIVLCLVKYLDQDKVITLGCSSVIILTCGMIGWMISFIDNTGFIRIVIFEIGICIVILICENIIRCYNEVSKILWYIAGTLCVYNSISILLLLSVYVPILKYLDIGVIGVALNATYHFIFKNYTGNPKLATCIVVFTCVILCLICTFCGETGYKYLILYVIGAYIVMAILLNSNYNKDNINIAWIGSGITILLFACLYFISFSIYTSMYYFLIVVIIALILTIIIIVFNKDDKKQELCISSIVLILYECMWIWLIIDYIHTKLWKYFLVFALGTFVSIYLFNVVDGKEEHPAESIWLWFSDLYIISIFICTILGSIDRIIGFYVPIITLILIVLYYRFSIDW